MSEHTTFGVPIAIFMCGTLSCAVVMWACMLCMMTLEVFR